MALTISRWIVAAGVGCALLAIGFGRLPEAPPLPDLPERPEAEHYVRVVQQTHEAARRWGALARRDAALAALTSLAAEDTRAPRLVTAAGLPSPTRTLIERTLEREWRGLGIDSARVPVTAVVVVDTVAPVQGLKTTVGDLSFSHVLAAASSEGNRDGCVIIVGLHAAPLAREGGHRALVRMLAGSRNRSALLGPCAFQARFGVQGPGIDAWLRGRSWDLAAMPSWETSPVPRTPSGSAADAERQAHAYGSAQWYLSPDARACAGGDGSRCAASLIMPADARDRMLGGNLLTPPVGPRDKHWGSLSTRYLSDLATELGPERFGRFWRSDLAPDAALRSVAAMPLDGWTQRWSTNILGRVRIGPGVDAAEFLRVLVLLGLCLAATAWGWGRREVR